MFGLKQNKFSFDHAEFYYLTVNHSIRDIQKELEMLTYQMRNLG